MTLTIGQCAFENPETRKAVWVITKYCPLNCKHCSMNSGPEVPPSPGLHNVRPVIQKLVSNGITKLVLSGGEPFSLECTPTIIGMCLAAGLQVSVSTSGAFASNSTLKKSLEVGLRKVTVSLDGIKEIHDRRRGLGAYEQAVALIHDLQDQNVSTTVNCVLGNDNIPHLKHFLSELSNLRVQKMVFCQMIAIGRARKLWAFSMESVIDELREFALRLQRDVTLLVPKCRGSCHLSGRTRFFIDTSGRFYNHCIYKEPVSEVLAK